MRLVWGERGRGKEGGFSQSIGGTGSGGIRIWGHLYTGKLEHPIPSRQADSRGRRGGNRPELVAYEATTTPHTWKSMKFSAQGFSRVSLAGCPRPPPLYDTICRAVWT